jgi:PAS domain S-box-containing protein
MIKKISPNPSLPKRGKKSKLVTRNSQLETKNSKLRTRAEKNLRDRTAKKQGLSFKDAQPVIHELQVHKIELEMQNEELRRAQIELEESRRKYSDLYDFAPVGYFTLDKNGLILEVNLTGADLLGLKKRALMKKPFSGFIHREDQDQFYLHCRKVFESICNQTCEIRLKSKSGSQIHIRMISIPVQDHEGTYNQIRTAVSNVTEQMELEKQNIHLASFPKLNPNPIIELNSSGEITYVNPAATKLFPDLMVKGIKHPLCADYNILQEMFKTREKVSHVRDIKVGNEWYEQAISYVKESSHIRFYTQNITRRKQAETAILENKQLNELLLDSVPHPTMLIRKDRTILAANKIAGKVGAILGDYCWQTFGHSEYISEEDKLYLKEHSAGTKSFAGIKCSFCLADELITSCMPVNCEVKSFGKLWDTWWVPVKDDIYLHYAIDITERKHAEEAVQNALNESRQRQAEVTALLEASRAVIEQHEFKDTAQSIFNSCKGLIGATAGYVALLSKDGTENEVLFLDSGGLPCSVDPTLPMPIRGLRETAYHTKKVVYENDFHHSEWMRFMPEGHTKLENVLFAPLVIKGETVGLLGLGNKPGGFTENDARMSAAFGELASIALYNSRLFELLKNNEEKFRSVAQTASDAIISADSHGNIIFWNSGAETIFGYMAEKVTGKPFAFIVPERFKEYHQKGMNRAVSKGVLTTSGKRLETTGVRKDGSEFPLELSLARWETKEGIFFTTIIRDTTEQKQAEEELERLIEELERSNKELEQFAYIASHDLQEPLRMVSSYVQLISKRYKDKLDQDADDFIAFIVNGTTHMQTLLHDLLTYSRVGTHGEPFGFTDLNSVFDKATINLKKVIDRNHADIKYENLPSVHADEVQMVQVFQNLIANAIKFRGEKTPRIHISAEQKENEWVLQVRDNGIGIDPKHFDRIFIIFKRLHTKEKYPGTGIGLAICKKIVERHGGRIWVESEPGKGLTFYFTIPIKGEVGSMG